MVKRKRERKLAVTSDTEVDHSLRHSRASDHGTAGQDVTGNWAALPFTPVTSPVPAATSGPNDVGNAARSDGGQPAAWDAKYAPRTLADLVVHARKVAEVRAWLENQLTSAASAGLPVLLLTGPPGAGKSSVVHVLADVIGFQLLEWTTPVPTLWQEHLHNGVMRLPYVSKLEEFVAFLDNSKKFPSLPLFADGLAVSSSGYRAAGKVLLIDDFPTVAGMQERARLMHALRSTLLTTQFPTVVVMTESAENGGTGDVYRVMLEIQRTFDCEGATTIAFNPVAVTVMNKLLVRVAGSEGYKVPLEVLSAIAQSCGGDVRSALACLQFLCVGFHQDEPDSLGDRRVSRKAKGGKAGRARLRNGDKHVMAVGPDHASAFHGKPSLNLGRDCSLALFHALGKLLYNKRRNDDEAGVLSEERFKCSLSYSFRRLPLDMEEPETILARASVESGKALAFLQENMTDFIDEEAIDDLADVAAYFSSSDLLLGMKGSWQIKCVMAQADHVDARDIRGAAAGSVAGRGVLFGNAHPAPRRWQALRSPALWQVEKSMAKVKADIWSQRLSIDGFWSSSSASVIASEIRPFSQRLSLLSTRHSSMSQRANLLTDPSSSFAEDITTSQEDEEMAAEMSNFRVLGVNSDTNRNLAPSPLFEGQDEDEIEEW